MIPGLETTFRKYLISGEEILWSGIAGPKNYWNTKEILQILFMLFFTGFALFWEGNAIKPVISTLMSEGILSALFHFFTFPMLGLLFVAAGFYMLYHKFHIEKKVQENTTYVITNKRILTLSGLNKEKMKMESINLGGIQSLKMQEFDNGFGTIKIIDAKAIACGYQEISDLEEITSKKNKDVVLPTLESIPDVTSVYRLINESMEKIRKTGISCANSAVTHD